MNVLARRPSSSDPVTSSRSCSIRSGFSAIDSVWRVNFVIGASAVRATSSPKSTASRIPAPPITSSSTSWFESALSTVVSGSATASAPFSPIPIASTRMWVPRTRMSV